MAFDFQPLFFVLKETYAVVARVLQVAWLAVQEVASANGIDLICFAALKPVKKFCQCVSGPGGCTHAVSPVSE